MCLYIVDVLCINKHTPSCLGTPLTSPGVFYYSYPSQIFPTDFSRHITSPNKRPESHEDFPSYLNSHSVILLATSHSTKQFSLPLKRYQSGS